MMNILRGTLKKSLTGLAALAIAGSITGVAVLGTATAAAAEEVADEVGVQSISCESGSKAIYVRAVQYYAWASCKDSVPSNPSLFQLVWKCSGQSGVHYSIWEDADGSTIRGYCPVGQRIDYYWPKTSPGPA